MVNIYSFEVHSLGSLGSNDTVETTAPRYGILLSGITYLFILRSKMPPGVIAALAITSTVAFLSITALMWLFLRRSREPKRTNLTENQDQAAENSTIPYTVPQAIPPGASKFAMTRTVPQGSSSA